MKRRGQPQPYRKGPRAPSVVLDAMRRGRTYGGFNPKDAERRAQVLARRRRSRLSSSYRRRRPGRALLSR